ncbi:hypothetical protein [Actinomadura sp. DC4]|uniref:hypothetical protein n=1 Tax=Actinomadura sp. DC4 TaxID=3055069 RepID=UPI0025AF886A|nr:hypothetical protein [Actinomadura sp. DC4]MDN3351901.1 hypothetical protein [Actinomadura sp. DC4]
MSSHSLAGPTPACVQAQAVDLPRVENRGALRRAGSPPRSRPVRRPFHQPSAHRPRWLTGYPEAVAHLGVALWLSEADEDHLLTSVLLRAAGRFMAGVNTLEDLRGRLADDLNRLMYPPAELSKREKRASDRLKSWTLPRGVTQWREVADGVRAGGRDSFYDRVVLFQATVTFGLRFRVISKSRIPDDSGPINGHLFVLARVPAEPSAGVTTDLWIPTRPVQPGAGPWTPGAGHGLAGAAEPSFATPEPSVRGGEHVQRRLMTVSAARDLVGRLRWRGATGPEPKAGWRSSEVTNERHPNDMARWLAHEDAPEPAETGIMNCWDAILFSAYRARLVDKRWLQQIYDYASNVAINATRYHRRYDRGDDSYEYPMVKDRFGRKWYRPMAEYYGALMATLYGGPLQRYAVDPESGVGGPDIPAGHIVFFDWPEHVAISAGTRDAQGRQIIFGSWIHPKSLPDPENPVWKKPFGFMQETTVEELIQAAGMKNATIEFAAPSWAAPPDADGRGPRPAISLSGQPDDGPPRRVRTRQVDYDRQGIAWGSSSASARTHDGELIPFRQRSCVSVSVIVISDESVHSRGRCQTSGRPLSASE